MWCRMLLLLGLSLKSPEGLLSSPSSASSASFGWQHTQQKHKNRKHGAGSKADVSDFSGKVSSKSWKLLMAAQKVMSSVIIAKKLHFDAKLEITKDRNLSYPKMRVVIPSSAVASPVTRKVKRETDSPSENSVFPVATSSILTSPSKMCPSVT